MVAQAAQWTFSLLVKMLLALGGFWETPSCKRSHFVETQQKDQLGFRVYVCVWWLNVTLGGPSALKLSSSGSIENTFCSQCVSAPISQSVSDEVCTRLVTWNKDRSEFNFLSNQDQNSYLKKTQTNRLTLEGQTSPLCSCSIFLTGSSCFPTFISHLTHKVKGQRAQGGGAGGDTYASAWGDMISVELHALRGVREAEEEEEHTHTYMLEQAKWLKKTKHWHLWLVFFLAMRFARRTALQKCSKLGHEVVIQQIIMVAKARHYTHIRKAVI